MDEELRAAERAALASPGDDAAVRAYLAAAARSQEDEGEASPDAPFFAGRPVSGPLLAEEAERIGAVAPEVLLVDGAAIGWCAVDSPRGRVLFAATLRLRIHDLGRLAGSVERASFAAWFALHAALDAGGEPALERLLETARSASPSAAFRAARLLAARQEPGVAARLAALAREVTVEARPRLYDALAEGSAPLDATARERLREAIAREVPALRARAWRVVRRGASRGELRRDLKSGPPEVRACAFEALLHGRPVKDAEAQELVRHALTDAEALVRLAAMRVLAGRVEGLLAWSRHPRAAEWAIGRLVDRDRGVRVEAARLLRRIDVPPRLLPRLRLVVSGSPPGIRPVLARLLERIEKRS